MATVNQILHRKNSNGTYDTIYLKASMSNVTGTLAIANGGTGSTSAANARSNLGITPANIGAAASSHSHAASAITYGSSNVSAEIDSLKSSVSNGKSLVAAAITDKGVSTASDATFQTMATNIRSIPTGYDLNIAYGNTAPSDTSKLWVKMTTTPNSVEISEDVLQSSEMTVSLMHAQFPNYVTGLVSTAVDTMIYAFKSSYVYAYNTVTDTITTTSFTNYSFGVAATINNKIYVWCNANGIKGIFEYLPSSNQFICRLENAVMGSSSSVGNVVIDGTWYSFGEGTLSGTTYSILAYNPTTNRNYGVSTKFPPDIRKQTAYVYSSVDGHIYFFGGYSSSWNGTISKYNINTDTYTVIPDCFAENDGARGSVIEVGGKIYIIGRYPGRPDLNLMYVYDPITTTITTLDLKLPSDTDAYGWMYNSSQLVGDSIYVMGGSYVSGSEKQGNKSIAKFTPKAFLEMNKLKIYGSQFGSGYNAVSTPIINGSNATIKMHINSAYLGDSSGYAQAVPAYVYNNGSWVQI